MLTNALESHPDVVMRSFSMDHDKVDQFMALREFRLLDDNERERPFRGTVTHQWGDLFVKNTFGMDPGKFWGAVACFFPSKRVIILNRKNLLRRYLSHVLACQAGFGVQEPRRFAPTIEFDFEEFLADLRNTKRYRREAEKAFPQALFITYEDLLGDYAGTMAKIQEHLGLPVVDLQPQTYRQESRPLRQIIRNWPEVEPIFRAYGMEGWLDGP